MPHLCVSETFSFRNLLMVLDGSMDNYDNTVEPWLSELMWGEGSLKST